MGIRAFLGVVGVATVVEVVVVVYYIDSAGFDCYPGCSTGQTVSGWAALLIPVAVALLAIVSLVAWFKSRPGGFRGHRG
jgi:hypothetical protein